MIAKVTVGLCIKNSGKKVETALDSISRQDYPHEALKVVIVAEDEKGDALPYLTAFIKTTDVKTQLFFVENKGLGASRQIVIDNADGKYVVWVDDDFVLKKDFITNHVEFMEKRPLLAAALASEKQIRTNFLSLFEVYLITLGKLDRVATPMGGFEIYRLKAVNEVGGFDSNIRGASEDRDIAIRLKNFGWELAVNKTAEYHRKYRPTTWKTLWRKHFWYGYGEHFIYHKYKNQTVRWELFFPVAFWTGVKLSLKLYKAINEKTVFLLALFYFFINAAVFAGFFRADIDGYGHRK
jgi:glycosyltransferase involved in cell wall biosynthesis